MTSSARLTAWNDWHRFATDVLGLAQDESVEYANLRSIEVQNRAMLRRVFDERPIVALREVTERRCSRPGGAA